VDDFSKTSAESRGLIVYKGVGDADRIIPVVIPVESESRTIVGSLVATHALVIGGRLPAECFGESAPHIGVVEFLVYIIYHVSVHVVDRLWAGTGTPAPTDHILAELRGTPSSPVVPRVSSGTSDQILVERMLPIPLLCCPHTSHHAPGSVSVTVLCSQQPARVPVHYVVEARGHRL